MRQQPHAPRQAFDLTRLSSNNNTKKKPCPLSQQNKSNISTSSLSSRLLIRPCIRSLPLWGTLLLFSTLFPTTTLAQTPTQSPTFSPTLSPTRTSIPSLRPSISKNPSTTPSLEPSSTPSASFSPSQRPTLLPSTRPSDSPSVLPSAVPSLTPSTPPSFRPSTSFAPSESPSVSQNPTLSLQPSQRPSVGPSESSAPSLVPTATPSGLPSLSPTQLPSLSPTLAPSRTVYELEYQAIALEMWGMERDLLDNETSAWETIMNDFITNFWNSDLRVTPVSIQSVNTTLVTQTRLPAPNSSNNNNNNRQLAALPLELVYSQAITYHQLNNDGLGIGGAASLDPQLFILPFETNQAEYTRLVGELVANPQPLLVRSVAVPVAPPTTSPTTAPSTQPTAAPSTQPATTSPTAGPTIKKKDDNDDNRTIIIVVVVFLAAGLAAASVYIVYLVRKQKTLVDSPVSSPTAASLHNNNNDDHYHSPPPPHAHTLNTTYYTQDSATAATTALLSMSDGQRLPRTNSRTHRDDSLTLSTVTDPRDAPVVVSVPQQILRRHHSSPVGHAPMAVIEPGPLVDDDDDDNNNVNDDHSSHHNLDYDEHGSHISDPITSASHQRSSSRGSSHDPFALSGFQMQVQDLDDM